MTIKVNIISIGHILLPIMCTLFVWGDSNPWGTIFNKLFLFISLHSLLSKISLKVPKHPLNEQGPLPHNCPLVKIQEGISRCPLVKIYTIRLSVSRYSKREEYLISYMLLFRKGDMDGI